MNKRRLEWLTRVLVGLSAAAVAGCGGGASTDGGGGSAGSAGSGGSAGSAGAGGSGGSPGAGPTYYHDVKPILDAKCGKCHAQGGIGPFPLTTYDETTPFRGLIKTEVEAKQMPPWPPAAGCSDYWGDRSLTDEQIKTISTWVDNDAPEGDPKDEGKPLDTGFEPKLSRVDKTLTIPVKYTQQSAPDDYRCFVIDWPETTTKYVSGFRANPGDARVVHHVIAFLVQPSDVPAIEALDAAEDGPGYTCFGGSGINNNAWLGGWAPGSAGSDFPPGTGIRVDPGSKVVIQVHYNTLTAGPQPDQTSVDFKIDDTVDKEGTIQPWTNPGWLSGSKMMIPAGETDVTHKFEYDPTPFLTGGQPFTMYSASLHMHTLGTRGKMEIHRANGDNECMLQIDDWNFHWQGSYGFKEPKQFNPGDKVYLECHWDNSAANQTGAPKDTWWGEGTTDEMCLGGFYMTVP